MKKEKELVIIMQLCQKILKTCIEFIKLTNKETFLYLLLTILFLLFILYIQIEGG